MAEEPYLQPVFVPPLLDLLVNAERKKGTALTDGDLREISDKGVCIMLPQDQVVQMDQARGYRDLRPENCLAEWHRYRGQVGGFGYLPKLILCLPGDDRFRSKSEPYLKAAGIEHEFRGPDPRMVDAFQAAHCRIRSSLGEADFDAIQRHKTVLYFLSDKVVPSKAGVIARGFLQLARRLLEDGAMAVKCESSGIAHSGSRWWELAEQCEAGADSGLESWHAMYCALVQLPIQSESDLHSCGMHLLGQPDMIVSTALIGEEDDSDEVAARRAVDLFNAFGLYLLAEVDDRGFVSGHTFSAAAGGPRYRVLWEPCEGYEEDEFFFNPFGRWRFVSP